MQSLETQVPLVWKQGETKFKSAAALISLRELPLGSGDRPGETSPTFKRPLAIPSLFPPMLIDHDSQCSPFRKHRGLVKIPFVGALKYCFHYGPLNTTVITLNK